MKFLYLQIDSYLQDTDDLLEAFRKLIRKSGRLPKGAKLVTCDAVAMYTNICTVHALKIMELILTDGTFIIPNDFPIKEILAALKIVMTNNVFKFGDTWYLQLTGTAMGTPTACIWATLYFAYYEMKTLLKKHDSNSLLLYKRFIDDGIGVTNPKTVFSAKEFKKDLEEFGPLRWTVSEPSDTLDFLDLTITIDQEKGIIHTKPYAKPMNLHLYIPAHSAHPPGLLKNMASGILWKYWRYSSKPKDYQTNARILYNNFLGRGYPEKELRHEFLKAANSFEEKQLKWLKKVKTRSEHKKSELDALINRKAFEISTDINNCTNTSEDPTKNVETDIDRDIRLFLHIVYHPKGISRITLRNLYDQHLQKTLLKYVNINKLTVAYSLPKKLKAILAPSTLYQSPGKEISTLVKEYQTRKANLLK